MVLEIGGEGQADGMSATSTTRDRPAQASGSTSRGGAILQVSVRNIALPPAAPAGVEPWDGPARLQLPGSGPIAEVVEDTVFEGRHTFYVGVTVRCRSRCTGSPPAARDRRGGGSLRHVSRRCAPWGRSAPAALACPVQLEHRRPDGVGRLLQLGQPLSRPSSRADRSSTSTTCPIVSSRRTLCCKS